MSQKELKSFYDFIKPVVEEAGQIVIEGFHAVKKVETKGNRSYDCVTDFDKRIEEIFTKKIKEQHPNHIILGEETCTVNTAPILTDSPTWIIDPIDGTINFIHELPMLGISIALSINKELVIGIVYNPIIKQFFSAIKGKGAFCNDEKIHSSKNEDLHKAIIGNEPSIGSIPFLRQRTLERMFKLTEIGVLGCLGSAALSLCYVANGSMDVYFTDGLRCWDVAAGVLILEEAGGFASNPNGQSFDMFSRVLLAAGNKIILQKMVEVLKECDSKTAENLKSLMPARLKEQLNIQE